MKLFFQSWLLTRISQSRKNKSLKNFVNGFKNVFVFTTPVPHILFRDMGGKLKRH